MRISVKNLEKNFGSLKVIDNISFDIHVNEFVSFIGKSGCGKSTLLYLIQGFIDDYSGEIKVSGKKGFVFQDHNLFPWKTVKENIEVAPVNSGHDLEIVDRLLKEVGLSKFKEHYPNQISEGMKQRVGIARALANNPAILFMDEPFGSLDYFTKLKMHDFILKLKEKHNLTIVFVTHDIGEAIKLSDRIIVLSERPARIVKVLDKSEFDKGRILRLINYSNTTI